MYLMAEDGVKIYYDDVGAGAPVVMVHGAATSGKVYDGLVSQLVAKFRCIRLDLRGQGRSDRVEKVSATAWCDDVLALLDHLEVEMVHLLGCSLGARIAGRLVVDHPHRFHTLTVDAPIVSVTGTANSRLNAMFGNPDCAPAASRVRWRNLHGPDWRKAVAFYGSVRTDPALQEHLTLRPHLSSIVLPTLITRGDLDDEVHPLSNAIEWHAARPSSWLWIAPDTASSVTQNRAEEYAPVFSAFVDRAMAGKSE